MWAYQIVTFSDISGLCHRVSQLINSGWVCVGGAFQYQTLNGLYLAQTMVKESEE